MTDFDALRQSADDSQLGRAFAWTQGRLHAALLESRTVLAVSKLVTAFQLLSLAERMRSILTVFGVAFVTYAVLLFLIPPYVATGIPRAWFVGIGAVLLAASTMSATLAMAVRDSVLARLGHWLVLPETHQGANPGQPQK